MIEHFDIGWMLLFVGVVLFCIAAKISGTRFEQWAKRDRELLDQWQTAFDSHDLKECQRLQTLMRENWESYRAKR